jgi:hypothetical protein
MNLRTANRFLQSLKSFREPNQALILLNLPLSFNWGSVFHRLSVPLLDRSLRLRSTSLCSHCTRFHLFLSDKMLFPPSLIPLGLLFITVARGSQLSQKPLLNTTVLNSRSLLSFDILSTECMRILLHHFHLRLQLPTNRANYLLARCLCPLV